MLKVWIAAVEGNPLETLYMRWNWSHRSTDCPSLVFLAVMKTRSKSILGRKEFIWLTHPNYSLLLREVKTAVQGRNWSWGQGRMLLNGLLSMACSAYFSYRIQNHLPKGGTARSGLGPPTTVSNQKRSLTGLPTGHHDGNIFSLELRSLQMTLVCVRLTKN